VLQIENAEIEVADELYETYTDLLVQTNENCHFCYKTYVVSNLCILFIFFYFNFSKMHSINGVSLSQWR